ncbi:undecaprenyl-phosphate glucose phosphotransferase [Rhizobium sp. SSA_523]|uniref:undecaprenyl-phosphate glucose phosphotransferase n=1 Tax=Rhizobium sp. SSA_523 TaxID=2952477 RepID=UPI002090CBDC|nr:undecaprenyl-phosphate glucose phosphotransferase [Rhizobium sp. SSA_523]MCO5730682.1 undecaprenyl-phosphate glucose phosphotransferase [Rhizobium sp. SSA_523]WKC24490.1 undecaprenyl-phosphate glucose phosphotransferase [Rhizobium sp. SSA_523]
MTEPAQEEFDVEALRRKVSDFYDRNTTAGQTALPELNPFARQIAEQFRDATKSPAMLIGQIRLLEGAMLSLAGLASALVTGFGERADLAWHLLAMGLTGALCVFFLQIADAYQIPSLRAAHRITLRLVAAWLAAFALQILITSVFGLRLPLATLILWGAGGTVLLLGLRHLVAFGIRNWSRNGIMERRAVIVGGGQPAKDLVRALEKQADNDIRICGIFDDRGSGRSPDVVAGYPKLGTFGELVEFARLARIDMLIIALPATAEQRILQLVKKLWILPVDIRLAAHAHQLRFRPRAYSHVGAVPMLDIYDKPLRDWDSVAKRLFDITFSVLALLLAWPVMIGCAIAVKATSKGPVFFVQKRHGFNNEVIDVLKFRSMYTELSDPTAKKAVTKNDPRVTPVGRFLRKSSLDELPQLFNVLRGELSLVGPRPHAVHAQTGERKYVDVVESYFARHRVKPGVTGWAQINGLRGELDSDEKIRARTAHDLDYIENWSLWLDLKILFLTPIRLLNTENAY